MQAVCNDSATAFAQNLCLHQLFEQVAERFPQATALIYQDRKWTYQELNCRANQLAHYLYTLGVRPETLVGICLDRIPETIVGLLGILKAGGAYVPLDPTYPSDRLSFMLQDAQIHVLLTQQNLHPLTQECVVEIIDLDGNHPLFNQESEKNLFTAVTPANLAYVIYTSGSTGQPKGVAISHAGVVNNVIDLNQRFHVDTQDRILAISSLSFDMSVYELLGVLCAGGTVVLPTIGQSRDPKHWSQLLLKYNISLWSSAPALLQMLLAFAAGQPQTLYHHLRIALLAGDWIPVTMPSQLQSIASSVQVVSLGGATEVSIYSTIHMIDESDSTRKSIPYGWPMVNQQTYLLNEQFRPVPMGTPGELYFGGVGLARGYFHRSDLTAEKFIPHPLSQEPSERLYRTGDLARYLENGELELLGRIDHQVKLHGLRIELGEIEAALKQSPGIENAVVVMREDSAGQKCLVAYLVLHQANALNLMQIKREMQKTLPSYMIPQYFVPIETWPLLPSGKIDRQKLPWPAPHQIAPEKTPIISRTPIEEVVLQTWSAVVGTLPSSVEDFFFESGGNSLQAMNFLTHLREIFPVDLSLSTFLSALTVEKVAHLIEGAGKAARVDTNQIAQLVLHLQTFSDEEAQHLPSPRQTISPRPQQASLPLSFAQQQLYFFDQLAPSKAIYNNATSIHLTGPLHKEALEWCFCEIVKRHEALRTTFITGNTLDGKPQQVIIPPYPLTLTTKDLRWQTKEEREIEARCLADEEAQRPFDLARGPLMRVTLLKLDEDEHLLLLITHHIISDGFSLNVLLRELTMLYTAAISGRLSSLPELPIQYADFAIWQSTWLRDTVLAQLLDYWRRQLQDAPPLLHLPTDRPRPSVQTYRGRSLQIDIPVDLTEKLRRLGRQENATLFMTVLAAFQTLLCRYTGQSDLVIGSPIANRTYRETANLIGLFTNILVLRTDLTGLPSFRELLRRVHKVTLEAYAHQDLSFEQVVEDISPARDLSYHPIFQVAFVLQEYPLSHLQLPHIKASAWPIETGTSKFDLTLILEEMSGGLSGRIEYSTELFDEITIASVKEQFHTLLEGIVANPEQAIMDLPLLTEAESYQILHTWNDTHTNYPRNQCIHQLFEAQVAQTPNAVAVVFAHKRLTYHELNQQANQLAHHLQRLDVGPGTLVGTFMDRSINLIVGFLGILKTGAAYVPLDPTYPKDRLAFMLEDAHIHVILTQTALLQQLPASSAHIIAVDASQAEIATESPENLVCQISPDNLAYVIYTSGSTGQPKGVAVPHRAVNRLICHTDYIQICPSDRVAQASNASFDAATFEIWGALLNGAQLIGISKEVTLSPKAMTLTLQEHSINILFLTTALFNQIVHDIPQAFRSIRHVLFGGESVDPRWVKEVLMHGAPERLLHVYGPTENTTFTTWQLVQAVSHSAMTIPIGRPVANTALYILDPQLHPTPKGIPGELYIGGEGLAVGYLNHPALTAEQFIPDPFGREPGRRIYRTSDIVRWKHDGSIEFLGRIDGQVKLRGFRLELGEIETILARHPMLKVAKVVMHEQSTDNKYLIAYIVPVDSNITSLIADLRSYLQSKLPDYMIPSVFIPLDVLPLTQNGKIDLRSLPLPENRTREEELGDNSPHDPVEEIVANIWAEVFQQERIGVHENFFDLGGHSLLAMQVLSRIRNILHVELPIHDLFEFPTVTELASAIKQCRSDPR